MLGPFPCGGKFEKLDLGNLLSKGKFYMSSIFPVGKFKYPVYIRYRCTYQIFFIPLYH